MQSMLSCDAFIVLTRAAHKIAQNEEKLLLCFVGNFTKDCLLFQETASPTAMMLPIFNSPFNASVAVGFMAEALRGILSGRASSCYFGRSTRALRFKVRSETSGPGLTWALARNGESQVSDQSCWIRICILTRLIREALFS